MIFMQICSKKVEFACGQYYEKTSWWIWIFLAQIPSVTSNEHNPSSDDLGKIHFFDILMIDFGSVSLKNPYFKQVVLGARVKLVILKAVQPQIYFFSQSTMFKEGVHQKSSMWLHFYNSDTTLKMLKIPLIFQTLLVVSLLIREPHQYQIGIFQLFCLFFDQVSMLTCEKVKNIFKTFHETQNSRKIHSKRPKLSLILTFAKLC